MLVAFSVVASFLLFVVVVVILLKEFLKSDVKVYALFMHHINVSFFFSFLVFFFQALSGRVSINCFVFLFVFFFFLESFCMMKIRSISFNS